MQNIASTQNPGARYFNKRLLKSLEVIGQRPFTLVKAPMGYGKTVAVLEFARTRLAADGRALWCRCWAAVRMCSGGIFVKFLARRFPMRPTRHKYWRGLAILTTPCALMLPVN